MANSNFEVTHKRAALDRIEHALRNADFRANRLFLGSAGYIEVSTDHIDEDYLEPLDNGYANIQKAFFESKKRLQSLLFDVQDVVEAIQRILRATDPIDALEIYDDVIAQHINGHGKLDLGSERNFGFDEDFVAAAENHKARLRKLRELGLIGNYRKLLADLEEVLVERLADPSFSAEVIEVSVTYEKETLANSSIRVSAAPQGACTRMATSRKGQQVAYFDLESTLPSLARTKSRNKAERVELVRRELWRLRRPVHREVDRLYLGEDLVAF